MKRFFFNSPTQQTSLDSAPVKSSKPRRGFGLKGYLRVTLMVGGSFLLAYMGQTVHGISRPSDSSGGPPLELQIVSPCPGYADMYANAQGGFSGSTPDFLLVKAYPLTVNGVSTWNILVYGEAGSGCQPSVRFTLKTPDTSPVGDYCAAGGCQYGQGSLFVP